MKNTKKSKLVFKISSSAEADGIWKKVIDFTKIKKGGVKIDQLLARLQGSDTTIYY